MTKNDEINALFHRLWTKAVGTPDYDKEEWKTLASLLITYGIYV